MSIQLLHLSLLSLLYKVANATCYYPDGSAITPDNHPPNVNSTDYQPCTSDTSSFSMCCATNRLVKGDTCMSNGLCHNGFGEYWRESCTDPTWNSPFCLRNICTNASNGDKPASDNQISLCEEDGSWCCGALTSQDCCASKNRLFLPTTVGISSPSSVSAVTSTSASSYSTSIASQSSTSSPSLASLISSPSLSTNTVRTSTPQTTPTATSLLTIIPSALVFSSSGQASASSAPESNSVNRNSQDTSHTTTIRIGIGVGLGSGILLILLATVLFLVVKLRRARRKKSQETETKSCNVQSPSDYQATDPGVDPSIREVHMLDGRKENHDDLYGFFHKSELGTVDELSYRSELSTEERGIYMMSAEREVKEVQGSIPGQ